jgi:predicted peptidase
MWFAALAALAIAQVPATFERKVTRTVKGSYLLYAPEGYDKDKAKKWPTILFLHGAGERGSDLEKVKLQGIPKELSAGRKLPFIVIAPQCPEGEWWDTQMLIGLLDEVERKWRVDRDRVYLTGLSMGGYGTWALAAEQPDRFAAIAPICGGGNPLTASKIAKLPIWAVHGDADPVVPVSETRSMMRWLGFSKAPDVKFTEVKGGKHDVWTDFYRNNELFDWFLTKKRGGTG